MIEVSLDQDTVRWTTPVRDANELTTAITRVSDAAFADGHRRLQAAVAETDHLSRRALFRSGFRLEGRRRQAITDDDGTPTDELIFARLATDLVGGQHGFTAVANSIMPRKRLIAHVLIRDRSDRIVLCETTFKTDWELPGGIVEDGEAPRAGAVREIEEELGIQLEPGPLLAIDWMPPYLGWDDACELIFDGGVFTEADLDRLTLDTREIKRAELIRLADAEPLLTPLSFRRLTAIMAAGPGTTLLLEDGSPVSFA